MTTDPVPRIAGMRVDPTTYRDAVDVVLTAARSRQSAYVCVANVHMVMEAHDDPGFRALVDRALLVTPDGQPLVWATRLLGRGPVERVYGPTLTLHVCEAAAAAGVPIALYGGTDDSLDAFSRFLETRYPSLRIACRIAPPFRPLTPGEDSRYTRLLAESGAGIVLVGIGCPRQERWMADHEGRIPAVMLGVGAAFDFHSGRVRQAPPLLQRLGLEWAFRLAMEPRRLWRRYAKHNPRFAGLFAAQLLSHVLGLDARDARGTRPARPVHRRTTAAARVRHRGLRTISGAPERTESPENLETRS